MIHARYDIVFWAISASKDQGLAGRKGVTENGKRTKNHRTLIEELSNTYRRTNEELSKNYRRMIEKKLRGNCEVSAGK